MAIIGGEYKSHNDDEDGGKCENRRSQSIKDKPPKGAP
jgi:hypothetical protein